MYGMRSLTVKPALASPEASESGRYRSLPFGRVETSRAESQVVTLGLTLREGSSLKYGEPEVLPAAYDDGSQSS